MIATTKIAKKHLQKIAQKLNATLPRSRYPIGPQLEALVLLQLGVELAQRHAKVDIYPTGGPFYVRLNQHKAFKGTYSSWLSVRAEKMTISSRDDSSRLSIQIDWRSIEVHNSVRMQGTSGASHEVDVCVMEPVSAHHQIKGSHIIAGIECKQHASSVHENIVRALLGVIVETRIPGQRAPGIWAIAATSPQTSVSPNTQKLMQHYGIGYTEFDVKLGCFQSQLLGELAVAVLRA